MKLRGDDLALIRVVGPDFVAGYETDSTVRRAAPILKALVGMSDDEARAYIKDKGWQASVVPDQPSIVYKFENFWATTTLDGAGSAA